MTTRQGREGSTGVSVAKAGLEMVAVVHENNIKGGVI